MGPRNKGSITRCTEFGKTPLSDIFRGQLRSRILRQGEESTDNVQPFFTLQLDIEVRQLNDHYSMYILLFAIYLHTQQHLIVLTSHYFFSIF